MSRAKSWRQLGAITLALTETTPLSGCARHAVFAPKPADADVDVGYGTRPHSMVTGAIASLCSRTAPRRGSTAFGAGAGSLADDGRDQ